MTAGCGATPPPQYTRSPQPNKAPQPKYPTLFPVAPANRLRDRSRKGSTVLLSPLLHLLRTIAALTSVPNSLPRYGAPMRTKQSFYLGDDAHNFTLAVDLIPLFLIWMMINIYSSFQHRERLTRFDFFKK